MKKINYPLISNTIGKLEISSAIKTIKTLNLSYGKKVKEFEKKFSSMHKKKYGIFVNSGSSANMVMLKALSILYNFQKNSEVLVPVLSWSTTYSPIYYSNLKPVFVDIDIDNLNIDCNQIEQKITKKTKVLYAVNLLGNPNKFEILKKICKKYNLHLLEDNCESLFAEYKNKKTGTFGIAASFSFFFSHHINTIEGGMIITDNKKLADLCISIRSHGWDRDSIVKKFNKNNLRNYFAFSNPGFNLRPTEINATIGLEQIKKLKYFIKQRRLNGKYFIKKFKDNKYFSIQNEIGKSSFFGLALTLKNDVKNKHNNFFKFLKKHGIECRPIASGNILRHPVAKFYTTSKKENFKNADYIHKYSLMFGNSHIDLRKNIDFLKKKIDQFFIN